MAFAGCGASKDAPVATSTAIATVDDEGQLRQVFTDYTASLVAHDWRKSCTYLVPETAAKLRANVRKLGYTAVPKDCPRLLAASYGAVESQSGQQGVFDTMVKTATVDGIDVTGNTATIDWHAKVRDTQTPIVQQARKINGEWKLIDVTN